MADLESLKKSVTEMTDEELINRIRELRSRKRQAPPKRKSSGTLNIDTSKMSDDDRLDLLDELTDMLDTGD